MHATKQPNATHEDTVGTGHDFECHPPHGLHAELVQRNLFHRHGESCRAVYEAAFDKIAEHKHFVRKVGWLTSVHNNCLRLNGSRPASDCEPPVWPASDDGPPAVALGCCARCQANYDTRFTSKQVASP